MEIRYQVDIDKPTRATRLSTRLYQGDEEANRITLELVRGGKQTNVGTLTVTGEMERADGVRVPCEGSQNGSTVSIVLNEHCYYVPGPCVIYLRASAGGVLRTMLELHGQVVQKSDGPMVDVNEELADLDAVIQLYGEMRTAKEEAERATAAADEAATDAANAATRADEAAEAIEGLTVSASPGDAPDAEITEQDGAKHIHFTLKTGATPDIVFEVATGEPGTQVQVQQSGTAENPVVKLTIPRGDTGAVDGIDYFSGEPSALGEADPGAANGVARGDHVHPMPTADDVRAVSKTDGAGAHNSIYRGKNLGDSVSDAQYAAIEAGTFDDMYIGDYWDIGGVTYRIAAFDYYYNTGDIACTSHHVTLIPDANMYTHAMNDTNITTGAYVGSKMYTEGLNRAKGTINTAFGAAHVLNHRKYLQNAVTDGYASGGSWYDSTVELMTEQNVYGCKIFGNVSNGTALPSNYTGDKSQYPLFTFRPDVISNRKTFWLRDVASLTQFARVTSDGNAGYNFASNAFGVCPAFSIIR